MSDSATHCGSVIVDNRDDNNDNKNNGKNTNKIPVVIEIQ